jgi:hypothetical protein
VLDLRSLNTGQPKQLRRSIPKLHAVLKDLEQDVVHSVLDRFDETPPKPKKSPRPM